MYVVNDIIAIIARALQPIIFDNDLEGIVLGVEIAPFQLIKFSIHQNKIHPYNLSSSPDIFLKGTLAQWIEFIYYKGARASIEISGDIHQLKIMQNDFYKAVLMIEKKITTPHLSLVQSVLSLLDEQIKTYCKKESFLLNWSLFQEHEKRIFALYYQIERLEQRFNRLVLMKKEL
ncbi:hypothetical protein EBR43_06870 [bacterium]|nr:hypothetical protein [bacterium]